MTKKMMQTGRDSTGIKHEGKRTYIPFVSHFCQQQKWKKIQDLNHSDIEFDLGVDAKRK